MHTAKRVAHTLLIIGGLNWGIYGVSGFNVVSWVLGAFPMIENIVYVLVGLSALFILLKQHKACCCTCATCETGDHCKDCRVTETKGTKPIGPSSDPTPKA